MSSGSSDLIQDASRSRSVSRRVLVVTAIRVLTILGVTLLAYALVPIEGRDAARAAFVAALIGISALMTIFARQMSRVSRARHPVLAAVEALSLVFGLFTCFFALVYVSMSTGDVAAFSEPISKTAGIYFTMTVLTTVGFGDITAASDLARVFVTIQMVMGAVLVAVAVKALAFSAKHARAHPHESGPPSEPSAPRTAGSELAAPDPKGGAVSAPGG